MASGQYFPRAPHFGRGCMVVRRVLGKPRKALLEGRPRQQKRRPTADGRHFSAITSKFLLRISHRNFLKKDGLYWHDI